MISSRRLVLLATMTLLALPLAPIRPQDALASCFNGEQAAWPGNYDTTNAYGTQNKFDIRNRDVDTSCPGPSTWSTANLGSTTADDQVEVGWDEYLSGSTKQWCVFWEGQMGPTIYGGPCQPGLGTSPGTGSRFKVAYQSSTGYFQFWVDVGSGYVVVPVPGSPNGLPANLVGMTHGWPRGEAGRRGGTGTGDTDDQSSLQYKTSSGGWVNWTENDTQGGTQNGVTTYHYCRITNTHYEFIVKTNPCP